MKALKRASERNVTAYETIVSNILRDHEEATHILSCPVAENLVLELDAECQNLKDFLSTVPTVHDGQDLAPEVVDRVASVGEKLSARFMTALLEDRGQSAEYVDLSEILVARGDSRPSIGALAESTKEVLDGTIPSQAHTKLVGESCQTSATGSSQQQETIYDTYRRIAEAVGHRVRSCGRKIPVITGYFGNVPGGLLKTVSRGYSDVLAGIVALGVDAKELQIWKEVSGIYTADPGKISTAQRLKIIHPSEANELTFYGSEVVHHHTIDLCMPKTGPKRYIRIKNVNDPGDSGTLITDEVRDPKYPQRVKRPTAVTVKRAITVVNVHSHRRVGSPAFVIQICEALRKWHLELDLFELNEMHVSLAVHSSSPLITDLGETDQGDKQDQDRDLSACVKELENYGSVDVVPNMAIISVIGREMKRNIGIAGKFFTALGDNHINIEMISQGASEINMSCLISGREARRALSVVHTELFTFLD